MSYIGEVRNGQIVFNAAIPLANGTRVRVEPIATEEHQAEEVSPPGDPTLAARPTLYDRFQNVIGKVRDLPADMANQHDHYLYGVPKK